MSGNKSETSSCRSTIGLQRDLTQRNSKRQKHSWINSPDPFFELPLDLQEARALASLPSSVTRVVYRQQQEGTEYRSNNGIIRVAVAVPIKLHDDHMKHEMKEGMKKQ